MNFAIFVEYPWIYVDIRSFAHAHGYFDHGARNLTGLGRQAILILDVIFLIYVKANVTEAWSFLLKTGSVALTTHLYLGAQAILTYVKKTILFPIKRAQTSIKIFLQNTLVGVTAIKSTQTGVGSFTSFTTQSHYPVTPSCSYTRAERHYFHHIHIDQARHSVLMIVAISLFPAQLSPTLMLSLVWLLPYWTPCF